METVISKANPLIENPTFIISPYLRDDNVHWAPWFKAFLTRDSTSEMTMKSAGPILFMALYKENNERVHSVRTNCLLSLQAQ